MAAVSLTRNHTVCN